MRRAPVTVATPERDLTAATWDELAAMSADADPAVSAAAFAEGQRRDLEELRRERMAAARKGYEALRAEWYDAAHAQYLQAETYCGGGSMLSALGKRKTSEPMTLWTGSEEQARRWASEELLEFWDYHCARLSFGTWLRQRARGLRAQRDDLDAIGSNSVRNEAHPATGDASPASSSIPPEQAKRHGNEGMNVDAADTETPAGAGAREAWEGSDHYRRKAEQRQADTASIRRERSQAGRAQVATRDTDALEPTAVSAPARRQRPDAPALLRRVLEETGLYLCEYVQFPSRAAVVAVVLWIAHAAARDEDGKLISRTSPRLLLTSAKNGSGKSTLLDLIGYLLHSRTGRMVKVTAAGLAKVLGQYNDVALPDDAQLTFGSTGAASKEIQAVLLGGYTRKGSWVTAEKSGGIKNVFGPAAVAGKDQLITTQADALADFLARSWIVRMERPKRYMPQPDEEAEEKGEMLGKALSAVMGAVAAEYKQAMRDLASEAAGQAITEGDGGRTAQIWRIGEAIARVAGGPWPEAMADAAEELAAAAGDLLAAEDAVTTAAQSRDDDRDFWTQIEELTQ